MRYWPMSVIANSPLIDPAVSAELQNAKRMPSRDAASIGARIALRTPPAPEPNLVLVESVGSPTRCVYLKYPSWEEWFHLERSFMVQVEDGGVHLIIEASH